MLRNRIVQMLVFSFVMSSATAAVQAGDKEFDAVVRHIKSAYHGKQQGGLGFAGFLVRVAHPAGVKSLRLAVFEDLSGGGGNAGLESLVRTSLVDGWTPLVRMYDRRTREQTFVYTRPHGEDTEFFVVSIDDEDATVIQAKIDPDSVAEWLASSNWLAKQD